MNNIELNFRDKWENEGNSYVKGRAFIKGNLLRGKELAKYFNEVALEDSIVGGNGFWGLVKKNDNSVLIIGDRMRSYPLFYGIHENVAYISDDPYWVKEKVKDVEFNEVSKNEFLLTGYVTGRDTLYENVKQIQPGEIISIEFDEENKIKIKYSKYYNFVHGNYFKKLRYDEILKEHEKVLLNSINRLAQYAGGRTIVIPLSGGYDSRLVATFLRKINYENVITFSYGRINNLECVISKEVAKRLKYKWIFIPYNSEKSYKWYNSLERKKFSKFGDNLSTILPDREWPGVWELKRRNLIPEDSIFAPGHSGDFISGGHIPKNLNKYNVNEKQFVEEILKKHYVMWNWEGVKGNWIDDFSKKILNNSEYKSFNGEDNAANAYEKWNWSENQIKRMVNSVKIYDYFGYDYWLPLWDYEYMDFWSRVPLKYRINKNLYDDYVVNIYSKTAHINIKEARKRAPAIESKNILIKIYKKLSKVKGRISKEELRDNDWEQSLGRLNPQVYDILLPYMIGRSSPMTLERLGYIKNISKEVQSSTLDFLNKLKG